MNLPRLILVLLVLGALCLVPVALLAADKPAPAAAEPGVIYPRATNVPAEASAGRSGGYTTLLFVALLMAGAAGWLLWRGRTGPGAAAAVRKLSIAETKSLGNRQFLVVASYDDKKFLLGVCPGRIDLLTQLEGAPPAKSP
jgi:flagellar protein FliO/FliZ